MSFLLIPRQVLEFASMSENVVWMDFNTAAPQAEPSLLEPMFPNPEAIATYMDLVFGYCEGCFGPAVSCLADGRR